MQIVDLHEVQVLLSWKNKKNIQYVVCWKFYPEY